MFFSGSKLLKKGWTRTIIISITLNTKIIYFDLVIVLQFVLIWTIVNFQYSTPVLQPSNLINVLNIVTHTLWLRRRSCGRWGRGDVRMLGSSMYDVGMWSRIEKYKNPISKHQTCKNTSKHQTSNGTWRYRDLRCTTWRRRNVRAWRRGDGRCGEEKSHLEIEHQTSYIQIRCRNLRYMKMRIRKETS